ncbi:MAG: hypothetical protein HYY20_13855 [Candidatus Tectomicrobia bacterium]|uniref:Uncharacterized protein n=1 Tax=Tectimicrobiota bacterium TaxID=2528274 RepID=A0A932CRT0_UNCTE|nr:hypothetical protein [Candidatus Tectomicrobia bacterium]
MQCPYYERVKDTAARWGVRGDCSGYLVHGMMIPSVLEEESYCLRDHGCLECPIYIFRQRISEGDEVEQMDLCFTVPER